MVVREKEVCQAASACRGTEFCDALENRTREANSSFSHKEKFDLCKAFKEC